MYFFVPALILNCNAFRYSFRAGGQLLELEDEVLITTK